jgi:demethylmenaquinone methyltransferase/2-methoxy-6-polyprenyl-1,4-benzoquinol methylase
MTRETDDASGRGLYDWWSRHPRALDAVYAMAFLGRESRFRRRSLETLALEPGERVLEVGCGRGNSFAGLREGVGEKGRVVGVDVSEGMTTAANRRIAAAGWGNVAAVCGDARRLPVGEEPFDAAYASMSMSAVPDPEDAVEAVHGALRPGGRFVVLDAQPFQHWPWRVLNPVVTPLAERATNWVSEVDVPAALRDEFDAVEVTTFDGGSIYVACARKEGSTTPPYFARSDDLAR